VRADPPGAIFCGRKATLIEIRQALSNGAARELEGLPSAFGGLLPHCALSGLLPERKSQFQSDQPENGQSIETIRQHGACGHNSAILLTKG
jgi:hypothetical protein